MRHRRIGAAQYQGRSRLARVLELGLYEDVKKPLSPKAFILIHARRRPQWGYMFFEGAK